MKIVLYKYEDSEYKRLGTTEKASDITYNIDLSAISEFEFSIHMKAKYASLITDGIFVEINEEFWGRVEDLKHDYTNEVITVSGRDLKSLLEFRQIIPEDYTSSDGTAGYMTVEGTTEYCIKYLWQKNAQSPPQENRAYPNMSILPNQGRGSAEDKYMARFEELSTATSKLCEAAQIGYLGWIDIENNWICFEVFEGTNKTAGQTDSPRAIFEVDRKNIAQLEYSKSTKDYKNAFYVTQSGAEFEDEALTLLYYRNDAEVSGFDRREIHLSISAESPEAGQEYEELKRLTQIEMKEHEAEEGFNCQLSPQSGYNQVWSVGDLVTIRHKYTGLVADIQITGVTITATENEINFIAKFGKQKPKFIAVGNNIIKI